MTWNDWFAKDPEVYQAIRSRVSGTFVLDARLPEQVFRNRDAEILFCEFGPVLSPELWPAISDMARWHGDRHVELTVLEPGCETFYLPEYRLYPALSVPVDADEDEYWAAIGNEPNGDVMGSLAISANVIAMTGASGRWGCWGERDPEVAIFQGFPDAPTRDDWRTRFGPFLDVTGALESYLPLTFKNWTVPELYATTLRRNYSRRRRP